MKRLRNTAVSMGLLFGAAYSLLAGDGQWTSEGLPHGMVYSLAIGAAPRTLFAGTAYGMFRSIGDGTWTAIPDSPTDASAIAVDPSDPQALYAGTFGGVYKSTDNGGHFTLLSGISVRAIAIDPAAPSTIYVGSGYTWDATTAFVGGLHKSIDGGVSWSALNTTSLVDGIASLVLNPRRPGTVYAGAEVYYDYPGYPPAPATQKEAVIGTLDGGSAWTGMLESTYGGLGIVSVPALAVDPDTGTLYVGANGSVLRGGFGMPWASAELGMGLNVHGVNALVIDPSNRTTMYAGTTLAGVFRSIDGGSTWAPMNDGLYRDETYGHQGLWIHSLVLDPADGVLRAGTENGIFAIRPNAPSYPCTPAPEHLCLLGGRYRVTVMSQHPTSLAVGRGVVIQQSDRFGSFSFPAVTGDSSFPEVIVKMVDPGGDRGDWVFHAGLTNLPYILSVTDTTTGRIETYVNGGENRLCGGADTEAFYNYDPSWDYAESPGPGQPVNAARRARSESGALSLLDGRFSVTLSAFSAYLGRTEPGVAVPGTDRYGYFSLPGFMGDPTFPEVFVKMVDSTAITGKFWFFHTGLTNLEYTLTVTDSVTGAVKTYEGRGDFCAGADVHAFTE